MDDALALLMLSELPSVGERTLGRVQEVARRNRERLACVLSASPAALAREYRIPDAAVHRLLTGRAEHEARCRGLLARLRAAGATIGRPGDRTYPRRLAETSDPPPIVYAYGNAAALESPTVAVLCSRDCAEPSVHAVHRIAQCAARERLTLVSGGMKAAHRIAAAAVRAAGAPRVVVLDRGLFAAFGRHLERDPFGLESERPRFDSRQALVITPFRCEDHAAPRNGRRRDRLVAALADVVIAAHARPGGEIERLCLEALGAKRCVLSWQGESAALVAAGARRLEIADLRDGLGRFLDRLEIRAYRAHFE